MTPDEQALGTKPPAEPVSGRGGQWRDKRHAVQEWQRWIITND